MPVRSYLEMRERLALRPAHVGDPDVTVERVAAVTPDFWRHLYAEVGRRYHWVDRLEWSDGDILEYLGDPAVSLWVTKVAGQLAGYFELRREPDGAVEIVYFGLLDPFIGRGLGGHMLTEAVERAWDLGATRVWLHTNTLDHPAALPNYLKRGFAVFKTEEYEGHP
jgi:ribosomal protein S18 acetylase RimI-like enzyme